MKKIMVLIVLVLVFIVGCTPEVIDPILGNKQKFNCGKYGEDTMHSQLCTYRSATANLDLSGCLKIKEENMKHDCIGHIAYHKNDETICKNIDYEYDEEECVDAIRMSKDMDSCLEDYGCADKMILYKRDKNYCESLSKDDKDGCLMALAMLNGDISLCDKIIGGDLRNDEETMCKSIVAGSTANVKICNKLKGEDKNGCIALILMFTEDESFCNYVDDEDDRQECLEEFSDIHIYDDDYYEEEYDYEEDYAYDEVEDTSTSDLYWQTADIAILDHYVYADDDAMDITVKNNLGSKISNLKIAINNVELSCGSTSLRSEGVSFCVGPMMCANKGDAYSYDIIISYTIDETGVIHSITGEKLEGKCTSTETLLAE